MGSPVGNALFCKAVGVLQSSRTTAITRLRREIFQVKTPNFAAWVHDLVIRSFPN
jgi:hypothetical protein